jgi:hypothetical protein
MEYCGSVTPRRSIQIYNCKQLPMKYSRIMILIYINYSLSIHYFGEMVIGNEMCTSENGNTWKIVY